MNVSPSLLRPKTSASLRQHQLVSGCSCGKWSSIVRGRPAIINETTALQDTRSVMHGIILSMCSRGRVDNCRNDDVRQGSMFLNGGYQLTTTATMWLQRCMASFSGTNFGRQVSWADVESSRTQSKSGL
jgi:hypothetical protein